MSGLETKRCCMIAPFLSELQLEQLNVELGHRPKNASNVIGGLVSQSAHYSHDAMLSAEPTRYS